MASEIFYDSSKIETVYNYNTRDLPVQRNGIRYAYVDWFGDVIDNIELKEYKKFIGKEYLITDKNQILPLYGITFKRFDYLVIWRDYNFDPQNPNNYSEDTFDEIQVFHRKIKKFIARELNSKIYYINTNEEALELLKRKKYNKIIIISNGNNNGVDFIIESRKIIGANSIAALTVYDVYNHVEKIKNLENVLILNGINLHEKFFKCIKNNSKDLYTKLKDEINSQYNINLNDYTQDLFNFPKFKTDGYFGDLTFD